jgi:hypothetical protein
MSLKWTLLPREITIDPPEPIAEDAANPHIMLFRGDRQFIFNYKFERTYSDALYGKGFYLTDNQEVAASYRTKNKRFGLDQTRGNSQLNILFEGEASSVEEILSQVFNNFYRRVDPYGHFLSKPWNKRITRKHHEIILQQWEKIKPNLISNYGWNIKFSELLDVDIHHRKVVVKCNELPNIGRVTVFRFPRHEVLSRTIDVDKENWPRRDINANRDKLINLGYLGLKYLGGRIMGNLEHECFVLWDADYVNRHRIRSIK